MRPRVRTESERASDNEHESVSKIASETKCESECESAERLREKKCVE